MTDAERRRLTVAVIGATGVLGRHVVPRLRERGHSVAALTRTAEQAAALSRLGVIAHVGDILDGATLAAVTTGADAVLHIATAVPRPGAPREWARNDAIRREGTANLLAAAARAGVRHYVQQSVAWIAQADGDGWVDEANPLAPVEVIRSAADMEDLVRRSALAWSILRGGLFYGPGSGLDALWRDLARRGELRLPGDGGDWLSLVHIADMAAAAVATVERRPERAVLNVADDTPVRWRDLYGYVADLENAAPPRPGGPPGLPSFRVRNLRARAALGWAPLYPSYRSGLV